MKTGFANGCFDLFHDGHRHFLSLALRECEYLVVAVNSDDWIRQVKGSMRPVWKLPARIEAVEGFLSMHKQRHGVVPFDGYEGSLIVSIRPDVYFQGYDHGRDTRSGDPYKRFGVEVVKIAKGPDVSTSQLVGITHARS